MDDLGGLPDEHAAAPANMNLSAAEVAGIRAATAVAAGAIFEAVLAVGKYIMPAFASAGTVTPATCQQAMAGRCGSSTWTGSPAIYGVEAGSVNQSLAYFLTTRGPLHYIGWGWESDQRQWLAQFTWRVGEPQGECEEVAQGVFSRAWSYGNATLDCNTFTAVVPALPPQ